jgi:hypothetical protein
MMTMKLQQGQVWKQGKEYILKSFRLFPHDAAPMNRSSARSSP